MLGQSTRLEWRSYFKYVMHVALLKVSADLSWTYPGSN